MRLPTLLSLCLAFGCAHSPTPPPGPRPLGGDANISRGAASLHLGLEYEVGADRVVTFLVELEASGTGSVGAVELAFAAEGFAIEGAASWRGEVPAGTTHVERVRLRPTTTGVATVTLTRGLDGGPLGDPTRIHFLISEEQIRACQAGADCEA